MSEKLLIEKNNIYLKDGNRLSRTKPNTPFLKSTFMILCERKEIRRIIIKIKMATQKL